MTNIDYVSNKSLYDWNFNDFIRYFGFVNQVASIRNVQVIESSAIQHFIFSGQDVKLQYEERLLMNAWWNYTLVSCISNIRNYLDYPICDTMVLWVTLNPRKLQLLFKKHDSEGSDYIKIDHQNHNNVIINVSNTQYDLSIEQLSNDTAQQLYNHIEENDKNSNINDKIQQNKTVKSNITVEVGENED